MRGFAVSRTPSWLYRNELVKIWIISALYAYSGSVTRPAKNSNHGPLGRKLRFRPPLLVGKWNVKLSMASTWYSHCIYGVKENPRRFKARFMGSGLGVSYSPVTRETIGDMCQSARSPGYLCTIRPTGALHIRLG